MPIPIVAADKLTLFQLFGVLQSLLHEPKTSYRTKTLKGQRVNIAVHTILELFLRNGLCIIYKCFGTLFSRGRLFIDFA